MNPMLKIAYDCGCALAEKEAALTLPLAAVRDMAIGGTLGGLGGAAVSDEGSRLQGIAAGVLAGLVPAALARRVRGRIVQPIGYEKAIEAVHEAPLRATLEALPKVGKKFKSVDGYELANAFSEARHFDPLRTYAAVAAPWALSGAAGLGTALGVNNILEDL